MTGAGGAVTVRPARPDEQATIANLFQLYAHDFSEFEETGSMRLEIGADGLFDPHPSLGRFWTEPRHEALILQVGASLAGFALIDDHSHGGATVDFDMAEFFVARKFRRAGHASRAVRAILEARPGRWEIAIARQNTPALNFWPRAIAMIPAARHLTTTPGDGDRWRGPILHFEVARN